MIKKSEGMTWPELVVGDKQGEFIRDSAQCAAIAERLMHLTSDELVSNCNSSGTSQGFRSMLGLYHVFQMLFCFS